MKAFLSHSSADKGFVDDVASALRPGSYELDSETFDAGLLNSQAILNALRRSDVFCLFLSENSIKSAYVDFETLVGVELIASGSLRRFLVVCLDETAFSRAAESARLFNVVRRAGDPDSTARLIQGQMLSAATKGSLEANPFIGRENELRDLEVQVTDLSKPEKRALFVSGNFGAGRRTLAKKFYRDQHPQSGQVIPLVYVDEFSGLEELYRSIYIALKPNVSTRALLAHFHGFELADAEGRKRLLAGLINALAETRELVFLYDRGGLLTDAGAIRALFGPPGLGVLQDGSARRRNFLAPRFLCPSGLGRTDRQTSRSAVQAGLA